MKEIRRMLTCNRLDLKNTKISTGYVQKSPRSLKGPLHRRVKSRDHEIVRAQKKVSVQNHVVWSRILLECNVKSHVTGSSTKRYFSEFLVMRVLTSSHMMKLNKPTVVGVRSAMVSRVLYRAHLREVVF